MGKAIFVIVILAAVGGGLYFFVFNKEKGQDIILKAKGYGNAENAEECLDLMKKGIKERNYNGYAKYLSGDYKVQVEKAAELAEKLGEAIDNLKSAMESWGVKSKGVKYLLHALDPFPKGVITEVKKKGDTEAMVTITADNAGVEPATMDGLAADLRMFNILRAPIQPKAYKAHKSGDSWVVDIDVTSAYATRVAHFIENANAFINGLDHIKNKVKQDAAYREKRGFENLVKETINDASKPG